VTALYKLGFFLGHPIRDIVSDLLRFNDTGASDSGA
jgi:hypothetical protein